MDLSLTCCASFPSSSPTIIIIVSGQKQEVRRAERSVANGQMFRHAAADPLPAGRTCSRASMPLRVFEFSYRARREARGELVSPLTLSGKDTLMKRVDWSHDTRDKYRGNEGNG